MIDRLRLPVTIVVGVSLALFCSCDRNDSRATPKPRKEEKVAPPLAPRFKAACTKIVEGKYDEAAADFAQINVENDPSQPLYDWIMVQQGLALMLAGKDADARQLFGKLDDAGLYSNDEDDRKLAKFFVKLAHSLRDEEPISADAANSYDRWTYEAMGLLFAGMKNWNLEKFDDALPILRQFFSSSPKGSPLWIGDEAYVEKLKEMANSFADDYGQYKEASEVLAQAKTTEEKLAAIDAAKKIRAGMKYPSKLTRTLDSTFAELLPKALGDMREKERLSAEAEAADKKAFAVAKEKGDALLKEYRYMDARDAYKEADLKQQDRIEQQNASVKKAQWLMGFKSNIIKEIHKTPYPGPVQGSNGTTIVGSVINADEEGLQIKTAQGVFPAKWTQLSPDSIYSIAESFIHPDTPPEMAAFRKWQLGVFGSIYGRPDALKLLKEAAEIRPIFEPELKLFQDSSGK